MNELTRCDNRCTGNNLIIARAVIGGSGALLSSDEAIRGIMHHLTLNLTSPELESHTSGILASFYGLPMWPEYSPVIRDGATSRNSCPPGRHSAAGG